MVDEERTDTQFYKIFFVWFSMNFNILSCVFPSELGRCPRLTVFSFSTGALGPIVFGLSLRDSCLVILFFNLIVCALPAYLYVTSLLPPPGLARHLTPVSVTHGVLDLECDRWSYRVIALGQFRSFRSPPWLTVPQILWPHDTCHSQFNRFMRF